VKFLEYGNGCALQAEEACGSQKVCFGCLLFPQAKENRNSFLEDFLSALTNE